MGARVVAVADSFDAMTADRPYRTALPVDEALARLRDGAGTQWDPEVVAAFERLVTDGRIQPLPGSAPTPDHDGIWPPNRMPQAGVPSAEGGL